MVSKGAFEKSTPAKVARSRSLAGSRRHAFQVSLPFAARARKKALRVRWLALRRKLLPSVWSRHRPPCMMSRALCLAFPYRMMQADR